MKPRLSIPSAFALLLAIAALLPVMGCKSNGNQELLERELRLKDDEIYELQSEVEDARCKLESTQRENSSLKHDSPGPGNDSPLPPNDGPSRPFLRNDNRSPASPRPPRSDITVPDLPQIDPGTLSPPSDAPPPPSSGSGPGTRASIDSGVPPLLNAGRSDHSTDHSSTRTPWNRASDDMALSTPASPADLMPPMSSAGEVKRIAINRLLSGSHSFGSRPGDEGVRVVFSARDDSDRPILAPGAVTVEVVDPEATGPAAQVARWDFSAEETAAHFQSGALAKGYHFDLIWPEHPPAHEKAKMLVHFTMPDGRKLEAQQSIRVLSDETAVTEQAARDQRSKQWAESTAATNPQQWAATSVPLGAQFDPASAPPHDTADGLRTITYQADGSPTPSPAATAPPSAPTSPASASATPIARGTRPVWSPYR